jgi:hypothetical protein
MINIRKAQLAVFDHHARREFEERLSCYIRHKMPTTVAKYDNQQLRQMVAKHMSTAAHFTIETEASVAQFVCLAFLPGSPFYENHLIKRLLENPSFTPENKMQCVVDQLSRANEKQKPSSSR